MKTTLALFLVSAVMLILAGCSNDDDQTAVPMTTLSFESEALEVGGDVTSVPVHVKIQGEADATGTVWVSLAGKLTYGLEYETQPAATNGKLQLALPKGQTSANFTVTKLADHPSSENILQMILLDPSTGYRLGNPDATLLKFKKN